MSLDDLTERIKRLVAAADGPRRMDLAIARILSVRPSTAGHKLTGRRQWKVNEVRELAAHYGVSAAALLDDAESRTSAERAPEQAQTRSLPVRFGPDTAAPRGEGKPTVEVPSDAFVVKVDSDALEPHIHKGQWAVVSESAPVTSGGKVFVEWKDGRRGFRLAAFFGRKMILIEGLKPPEVVRKGTVKLHKVIGSLDAE